MDIVDIEKLRTQYEAGISIRKLSILWNLPYASLYRAINKGRKGKFKKKKTGSADTNEVATGS